MSLFFFFFPFSFFFFFFFVFLNGSLMICLDLGNKRGNIVEFTGNCFSFSFVLFAMNFDKKGQKNWVNRMFFFPLWMIFWFFFFLVTHQMISSFVFVFFFFFWFFFCFFFVLKNHRKRRYGVLTQEIILGVHRITMTSDTRFLYSCWIP